RAEGGSGSTRRRAPAGQHRLKGLENQLLPRLPPPAGAVDWRGDKMPKPAAAYGGGVRTSARRRAVARRQGLRWSAAAGRLRSAAPEDGGTPAPDHAAGRPGPAPAPGDGGRLRGARPA